MKRSELLLGTVIFAGIIFIWGGRDIRSSDANPHQKAKVKHSPKTHSHSQQSNKQSHTKVSKKTRTPKAKKSRSCSAVFALDKMDPRVPVPLQPMMAWHQKQNMQGHLRAIQQIIGALAKKDWKGVLRANRDIESSPQMRRMCSHMGAGAKGFTNLALEFHRRADAIAKAAKKKNANGVLKAVSHTLQACNACHASYKQEIVDAKTWQMRTGSLHKPGGHMHHKK